MQLNMTEWDFSKVAITQPSGGKTQFEPLDSGEQVLFIDKADYNSDTMTFKLLLRSVAEPTKSNWFSYFIMNKEKTELNAKHVGILNSLKKALGGPDNPACAEGFLSPKDCINGLVTADVVVSEGYTYPSIFHFQPIDESTYYTVLAKEEFAGRLIQQYVEPSE